MTNAQPFSLQVDDAGPHTAVGVIRLEQPGRPVVVLDLELFQRLEATLAGLSSDLRGLVVASASERVFVAGADLKAISELDDAGLAKYLQYGSRVMGMLASLPFPTAAAINGAALGGGLELAMHCDGLVASPGVKPYPVGLPEAGLGICPGWGGTNLLPARIDPADALARTATGKPMMFDEAVIAGMFDAVEATPDRLLTAAKDWLISQQGGSRRRDGAPLRWIGRGPLASKVLSGLEGVRDELVLTPPGLSVVAAVEAGLAGGWSEALVVEQRELVRLRNTESGKSGIRAFFEKSRK